MKGRHSHVALAVAALVLTFAPWTAEAQPAPAAHPTVAAKHRPGCQTFFTHDQIVTAIGGPAAITSLQKAKASAIYGRLIPKGQNCGYLWDTTTDPPGGDPEYSCDGDSLGRYSSYSPGYGWIVAYDYTSKQWKHLEQSQKHSAVAPDPNSNPNQPVTELKIHKKTKAFAVTDPAYCSASGAYPATTLYVWTKHHDLLTIFLWPATQGAEVALATSVLTGKSNF